jgi:hypothetical protein
MNQTWKISLKTLAMIGLMTGLLVGTLACETADDDTFFRAQACLDKATDKASADACSAMVAGKSGTKAAIIQCSAIFIGQGFTTTSSKFIDAFKQLDNPPAGVDPTVAMASYMVFTAEANAGLNLAAAESAFTICQATELPGMIMFAGIARLGTQLSQLAAGGDAATTMPQDPAALAGAVTAMPDAAAGQIAKSVGNNYCKDTSTSSAEFCDQFNQAVAAGSTDAEIGQRIKDLLAH